MIIGELDKNGHRKFIENYFNTFYGLAKHIRNENQPAREFSNTLKEIHTILKNNKYSDDLKNQFTKLISCFIEYHPKILRPKGQTFLILYMKAVRSNPDTAKKFSENEDSIKNVMDGGGPMRNRPITNRTEMEGVLQTHVRETETLQYAFMNMIKNDTSKDVIELFSIDAPIQKNTKWVTDSTAIRDAISHSKYTLTDNEVIFNNTEHGYDFQRTFTYDEFKKFMGLKGKLLGLFGTLIQILMFAQLLQTYETKFECRYNPMNN